MAFKDKTQKREYQKRWVRQKREEGLSIPKATGSTSIPEGSTEIPVGVDTLSNPELSPEWQHVRNFISRPRVGVMSNLEKLQRIAGSLGKLAGEVWFGDLTLEEIGKVIGVEAPLITRRV